MALIAVGLSLISKHVMNPSTSEQTLYEGTADPPRPNDPETVPVLVRLHRVRAVADALGDALETDGQAYSPHLTERALVANLMSDELALISVQLGGAS